MEIAIMNYTAPNNDLQYTCVHNRRDDPRDLETTRYRQKERHKLTGKREIMIRQIKLNGPDPVRSDPGPSDDEFGFSHGLQSY
jgi:hypothetical protein